jgi:DNA-binding MarR family transcriptional regulator
MARDFVRTQGYLTLGSRLKRIGDRLQADAQVIFKAVGVDLPVALMPTLHALANDGDMTIGELAESLGVTQPGVTRNAAQLEALGLVRTLRNRADRRVRTISLTKKGADLIALAVRELDPWISSAVAEVCSTLEGSFLDQLAALEDGLAKAPLHRRGTGGRARE